MTNLLVTIGAAIVALGLIVLAVARRRRRSRLVGRVIEIAGQRRVVTRCTSHTITVDRPFVVACGDPAHVVCAERED